MTLVERNQFNPTINLIGTTAAYDLSIYQAANSSVTVYICDIAIFWIIINNVMCLF